MAENVARDQLALIKIEGMHCHKCEVSIQKALAANPGVHEVEVDFNSGQASVLFDRSAVLISQLMDSVTQAGYRATGFTQGAADHSQQPHDA
jgi:copper chaperone CopZ